jgi:hypothetical protein
MTDQPQQLRPSVAFTIDGRRYETRDRKQPAADLLRLAGLDPALYDLGELRGHRPEPTRYKDAEIVDIHPDARFVTIRQTADVA